MSATIIDMPAMVAAEFDAMVRRLELPRPSLRNELAALDGTVPHRLIVDMLWSADLLLWALRELEASQVPVAPERLRIARRRLAGVWQRWGQLVSNTPGVNHAAH
jgi:hypothetical protein